MINRTIDRNVEKLIVKLEPKQAPQLPFLPGCPVVTIDEKFSISGSGEVKSIHISFEPNVGSCKTKYNVVFVSCDGNLIGRIFFMEQIRYTIRCSVKFLKKKAV